MPLTAAERATMIERYARGPALLAAALAKVPRDAVQWKPGPDPWSGPEILGHCADSEPNAHMRLLGIVNAVIRPVILILTLPLTVLTLGLFIFVVNGISFYLVHWLVPGFSVSGLGAAVLGSIVVGLTGWCASAFVGGSGKIERYRRVEVTGRDGDGT